MHIEKRIVGKRVKYFLAYSYREGSKVYKFRKYLGQDLNKTIFEQRKNIAEKLILEEIHRYRIISDPLRFELSREELDQIRQLQAQIPLQVSHLSESDWREFSQLFTYNTNAIEGSTLNQKEVKELLEKDKWPNRSKEDIAEAFGVDEAITFIRTSHEQLSVEFIKKIHQIIFKNSKPFAGRFRKKGEEVVVIDNRGTVVHEGAPPSRVRYLLNQLVQWYDQNKLIYPGMVLAAVVHNQFENIHPFADGNGRVGRILLNYILLQHHWPPLNIDFKNRREYYATLQAYEKNHDLKPTLTLYLKEYQNLSKKLGDYKKKKV